MTLGSLAFSYAPRNYSIAHSVETFACLQHQPASQHMVPCRLGVVTAPPARLLVLLIILTAVRSDVDIIPIGSVWKYDDSGVDRSTTYHKADFDDSGWKSGKGACCHGIPNPGLIVLLRCVIGYMPLASSTSHACHDCCRVSLVDTRDAVGSALLLSAHEDHTLTCSACACFVRAGPLGYGVGNEITTLSGGPGEPLASTTPQCTIPDHRGMCSRALLSPCKCVHRSVLL